MSLNRRDFIRLLSLGVVSQTLDIEKLLWVPGVRTIFIPNNPTLSMSQIVAIELERILPSVRTLFERDDIFYTLLKNKQPLKVSGRGMSVPLILKPGGHE